MKCVMKVTGIEREKGDGGKYRLIGMDLEYRGSLRLPISREEFNHFADLLDAGDVLIRVSCEVVEKDSDVGVHYMDVPANKPF